MKTNWLTSTIVYVLIIALTCLLFFGLGESDKTEIQLVAFGFLIGAITVVYLSVLIAGFVRSRNADIVSAGLLFAVAAFLINNVFDITTTKTLVIINIAAIIIYLLLLTVLFMPKKK